MTRLICIIFLISVLVIPVSAAQISAPEVPEAGKQYLPNRPETFSEGLLSILKEAISVLRPELIKTGSICLAVFATALLLSAFQSFDGSSKQITALIGSLAIAALLLGSTNILVGKGRDTVIQISEYGKLLLPVMATALAAQGGVTSSAVLYTATAVYDTLLVTILSKIMLPMIYIYLALAIANAATGDVLLKKIRDLVKWTITWTLKTSLIIFTGYISITGVVSGTTDAAALKATKLTISSAVPVVGNILSDASEAVLVGAGMMKNGAGIYGLLAVIALMIGPIMEIGLQYLLLKATSALSGIFSTKHISGLTQDFSDAMGLLLAMIFAGAFAILISVICFMKGVA